MAETEMELTPTEPRPHPAMDVQSPTLSARLLNQGGTVELDAMGKSIEAYCKMLPPGHPELPGLERAVRMLVNRIALIKVGF
jgi:hypothetical protein